MQGSGAGTQMRQVRGQIIAYLLRTSGSADREEGLGSEEVKRLPGREAEKGEEIGA